MNEPNETLDMFSEIHGVTPKEAEEFVHHALHPDSPDCPNCGAPPNEHIVKNYSIVFEDGDVVCTKCNTKVRDYDAG